MSDKQAAVIYPRVASRSWRNNTCLRSELVEVFYTFMFFICFSINFQTSSCGFFVCLFSDEIAFSSILRIKTIYFRPSFYPSRKKISAGFQFETDAYDDHILRTWYNGSYTMMAKPIKTLELHYQMIQFLINSEYSLYGNKLLRQELNVLQCTICRALLYWKKLSFLAIWPLWIIFVFSHWTTFSIADVIVKIYHYIET